MNPPKIWSEVDKVKLREMLGDGKSYKEIAAHFSTTRSAVSGVVKRSGLQGWVRKETTPPPVPFVPEEVPTEVETLRPMMLTIDELTDDTCRAPFDTEEGTRYCGNDVHVKTYCAYHRSKYFIERRVDAHPRPYYRRG